MTTVLITGTNRGIGLELVRQYAADGAKVFACCRRPRAAETLQHIASESGGRVTLHQLDVTNPNDIAAFKKEVGNTPIDILINNAGVSGGQETEVDYEAWEEAFRVNSIGPHRLSTAFRANLAAGTTKKLATISSRMGSIADNTGGWVPYRASKAAINQVMKSLAIEYRNDGITVIILHPGWVHTDMGGPQAPLSPEESARGLKQVIESFSIENTGKFVNYQGQELPW